MGCRAVQISTNIRSRDVSWVSGALGSCAWLPLDRVPSAVGVETLLVG